LNPNEIPTPTSDSLGLSDRTQPWSSVGDEKPRRTHNIRIVSSCYALCKVRHRMARYLAVCTRLASVYCTHRCGVEIRNLSLLDVTAVSAA